MTLIEIIRKGSECESKCLCIMFGRRGEGERGGLSGGVRQTVRIENQVLFSFLVEVQRCPKMKSSCIGVQAAGWRCCFICLQG